MRKISLIVLLFTIMCFSGRAGQDPLYTQFMTNPFLINPALTGTYNHYQIITNNRLQWVGMADAPLTNIITLYGPMVEQPMGIGGFIVSDRVGPESKLSFNGTYAYNYSIQEDLKISLGLMLGIFQHKIDGTDARMKELDDPKFRVGEVYQNYKPDASFGVYLYSSIYNVGLSVTNMFGNKLTFYTGSTSDDSDTTSSGSSTLSRLKQHIYLHGGYKYFINREISVEPSLLVRKVAGTPFQVDFNVRGWYGNRAWNGNKVWGGIGYRSSESISILVGVIYQKKIEVGYSYDIGINQLNPYHAGSHELMITFRFNDIKKY